MAADPKDSLKPAAAGNAIAVNCPCGKNLSVKAEYAGKKIKCGSCQRILVVPATETIIQPMAESLSDDGPLQQTLDGDRNSKKDLWSFLAPPQAADEIGRLGPYRVLQVLGAGGMGVVFKAEDPGLKRLVALKAMLPSAAESASAKERFLREARSAAALKHDHIVSIFQVGEDHGVPYLAMEFLEGEPLDERLKREGRLPMDEVLRIGREIADGLEAAHDRGMIHRDIKPANVWMEKRARRKDAAAISSGQASRAKILDFGLARGSDDAQITRSGVIVGTPAYMPPEQARGQNVDRRCDLYSLGVVLYKMATGDLPFKGHDTLSVLAALALDTPVEPWMINKDIPTRLNDLIMKLLSKNPDDRPGSAQEVYDALNAITLEPSGQLPAPDFKEMVTKAAPQATKKPYKEVAAKPKPPAGSPRRRSPYFLPLVIIGGAFFALALVALGIVIFWPTPHGIVRIESDDPNVEIVFDKAGPTIKGADTSPISLRAGEHGVLIKRGDFEFAADTFLLKEGATVKLKVEVLKDTVQLSRDGKFVGAKKLPPAKIDTEVAKVDPKVVPPKKTEKGAGEQAVLTYRGHSATVHEVAFSPDGEWIVSGSDDGTAKVWHVTTGKERFTLKGDPGSVRSVDYSRDGSRIVSSCDNTAKVWDAKSGDEIATLKGHSGMIFNLAFGSDGKQIVSGSGDRTVKVWDAASGKDALTLRGHTNLVLAVALSTDGQRIVSGSADRTAKVWDATNEKGIFTLNGHTSDIHSVAFSANGKRVVSGGGNVVKVWDATNGQEIHALKGHTADVFAVAISPDGQRIVSGSADRTVKVWDAANGEEIATLTGHTAQVWGVAISRDGKRIASSGPDKTVKVWDMPQRTGPLPEMTNSIGMKLVAIPPGKFLMGSPADEKERKGYEVQHEVEITKGFWMGKFEVTQDEYEALMGNNPSHFKGPKLPVSNVSWNDAKEFCKKLSKKEGKEYSLPTEAEWEYACRAGTKGPFSTGENLTTEQANYNGTIPYAANANGENREKYVAVGSFAANGFGLHDMHGNVWEWCEDWHEEYGAGGPVVDPKGNSEGTQRVIRGGGWADGAWYSRSANRLGHDPTFQNLNLGFRIVLRAVTPSPISPEAKQLPPLKVGPLPEMTNSIGMKLVAIPAGKFLMGSPESEKERDYEPLHPVEITKGFWMGKYEVTQEEYEKVMGNNPSTYKGPKMPVEKVSWDDAKEFCKKLSEKEGKLYTLPTEAEWEYACRAGTTGPFSTGENLTTAQANYDGDEPYAGNPKGEKLTKARTVGSYPPNAFGLHDMHGNVWEWCEDWREALDSRPVRDPKGPPDGMFRIYRGGSWSTRAGHCRSAYRNRAEPTFQRAFLGFRVVLRSDPPNAPLTP